MFYNTYNRPASSKPNPRALHNEEEKKIRNEKESATESNPKPLLFRQCPPFHTTGLTRSSIGRPRFFLPSPSFLFLRCSIQRCLSSSPTPKAPTFSPLSLGVYGLVRCRKQRVSLCCFAAVFVRSWELNLTLPSHSASFVVRFGFRGFVADSWLRRLGSWFGKGPLSRRRIWCGLMASCQESAMQ
jgi:hypothetical protein